MLATRPLLLSCLSKLPIGIQSSSAAQIVPSESLRSMLRVCIDSAQLTTMVLDTLQKQNLIGMAPCTTLSPWDQVDVAADTFLSFDLEATFSSAIIILMAQALYSDALESGSSKLQISYSVLHEMVARGNIVAQSRKNALKHFESVLVCLTTPSANNSPEQSIEKTHSTMQNRSSRSLGDSDWTVMVQPSDSLPSQNFEASHPDRLSAAQLQSAVRSFSAVDLDWILAPNALASDETSTMTRRPA